MSENLEDVDGVTDIFLEGGVNCKVMTELVPQLPGAIVGIGSCRYDSVSARKLCSAEVTEEIISGLGVSKRQGRFCG